MQEAYHCLVKGNYAQAMELYEQAILEQPDRRSNYGYLGLTLLLQARETEAQITWSSAVDTPEDFEDWAAELDKLLNAEAERYTSQVDYSTAWLIRQHLTEIAPQNIYNLSEVARLSLELDFQDIADRYLSQLIDILADRQDKLSDRERLAIKRLIEKTIADVPKKKIENSLPQAELQKKNSRQATLAIVDVLAENLNPSLSLVKLYLEKIDEEQRKNAITAILDKSESIPLQAAILYSKACFSISPDSVPILKRMLNRLQRLGLDRESVEFALMLVEKSEVPLEKASAYYAAIRGYMNSGVNWQEAYDAYTQYQALVELSIQKAEPIDDIIHALPLAPNGIYSFYLSDAPASNRNFLGRLGSYYQSQIRRLLGNLTPSRNQANRLADKSRRLRIGYISECLRRHSVGWLSRWLLIHHDRDQFDIFVYSLTRTDDNVQTSVKESVTHFYHLPVDTDARVLGIRSIAEQIQNDGIDILIDLDALTSKDICAVVALKPAPIQVTWLGSDASGIPAIDYFIADPYVLPESAESYYNSKIWRLPQTYLAVNGFEVGVPNLRREDLDIPQDAVVYLCLQAPHKLHPDFLRMLMHILDRVPNSFLLVKNLHMTEELEAYVSKLAVTEGVSPDRLRFLSTAATEELHRANLAIADVILDAYPYNGATTTLEALWMEIPVVTRVGEMFVARNGYTLMTNAGITEGIARTNEEYIEWGVRLGSDPNLRQQISLKLKRSKRTSPLWNATQFAREMESAYKQMWEQYLEIESQNLDIDPSHLQAMVAAEENNDRAISLAQQGDLEMAISLLQTAIELNPDYVDAHYNMGIVLNQRGDLETAIDSLQTAISLNPEHSNALYNLGIVLMRCGRTDEAIANFCKVLEISPFDLDTHLALGNAYFDLIKLDRAAKCYRNALCINPKSASAHCSIAVVLSAQGNHAEAISHSQAAIDIDPNLALAYCNMACALSKFEDRLAEAVQYYQTAIRIDPGLGEAYWNLTDILNTPTSPIGRSYPLQKELADQFIQACVTEDRIRALSNYICVYSKMGLSDRTQDRINELESLVYTNSNRLTKVEIQCLYSQFIFTLTSLRDNLESNSRLFKLIGQLYVDRVLEPTKRAWLESNDRLDKTLLPKSVNHSKKLRIGFLSSHFKRHPVGWCSLDIVRELSFITPHIYLYSLDTIESDERTTEFAKSAERVYFPSKESNANARKSSIHSGFQLSEIIQKMLCDRLDILIDLDSVTILSNVQVLYEQPAPICISWLGFDAPYITPQNYCLGDWYTHPDGSEKYYPEQIVRLPDSHMAVSGFGAIPTDRDFFRNSLGISPEQVAYLYAAPGRKFNLDSAKAQVEILKNVPDSILMHRGSGDFESLQSVYIEACEMLSVDFTRIKFMMPTNTEEEHRSLYSLADIFLDAYPYNGGSHNLEALWFNLPVVTRVGEQSFGRMGYSFLQTLGIRTGIAWSWEEYVEWGIQLGRDANLRNSVREQLIQSKQSEHLSPLWNPKKLAKDMYAILEKLLAEKEKYKTLA